MKIHIPNPCTEKYDNMSPTELGRMCKVCNTEVVDFTNWETKDIVTYIQKSNQKVCGILKSSVQDKSYSLRRKNWLAISTSILLIGIWNNLNAIDFNSLKLLPIEFSHNNTLKEVKTDSILIRFVHIENKSRINNQIKFKNKTTNKEYLTDSYGQIKINFEYGIYLVSDSLFEFTSFSLKPDFNESTLEVPLEPKIQPKVVTLMLGSIATIEPPKEKFSNKLKRFLNIFTVKDED